MLGLVWIDINSFAFSSILALSKLSYITSSIFDDLRLHSPTATEA